MAEMQTTDIIKSNHPKTKNFTKSLNHVNLQKNWIVIDLKDVILGRVASFIAHRLIGKHRPDYTAHIDCGDHVIVLNADKVFLTGNKENDKIYHHHTGFVGGIKSITVKMLRQKNSHEIIKKAVTRMLGRGPLAYKQLKKLYIYSGSDHSHSAQKPISINFSEFNKKNNKH